MTRTFVTALAALLGTTSVAHAQNALGANYNEHFEDVDARDLDKAQAKWVRLFLPMVQLGGTAAAADHGAVRTIRDLAAHGRSTILSLKFRFPGADFPRPGSPEMAQQFARLDAVLPLVIGKIDILVIGNEPYIESRPEMRDADLNAFYEAIAARAIAYRHAHCPGSCKTRLYMGALNRMDLEQNRTPSTERWMAYVKATPEIAGVDIHPHLPTIEGSKAFLDYILPRMRPEQKFLVTEFSIVRWWQQHMKDTIPAAYAAKYRLPATTQTWQVIRDALATPVAKQQWDDFLSLSPWFESRKHYLRNQMTMFRATGRLAVATYGFKQGSSMAVNFNADSTPWLINSVFAGRTIRPNADGSAAANYAWIDDFRALQK